MSRAWPEPGEEVVLVLDLDEVSHTVHVGTNESIPFEWRLRDALRTALDPLTYDDDDIALAVRQILDSVRDGGT